MPAINHSQVTGIDGKLIERVYQPEPDRVTVRANGIVTDIIANEDGSVYIEWYAYEGPRTSVVMRDNTMNGAPNVTVRKAE